MPQAKDSRGRWWEIVVQGVGTQDCGYACAAMVCHYYLNKQFSIAHMEEKAAIHGNAGQVGLSALQIAATVLHNKKVKVWDAAHYPPDQMWDIIFSYASKKTPMIVGLNVTETVNNSHQTHKHLTVAIDVASDHSVTFLDPYPGVGVVEMHPGGGGYTIPNRTTALDGWLLATQPH